MEIIEPDWLRPPGVRVVSTTRRGGVSAAPFDTLNLGSRTADDPEAVAENRRRLLTELELPESPRWLRQVHSATAIEAGEWRPGLAADAAWSERPGEVLAVLTADCLPVVVAERAGARVAIAHAGWRGLAAGVLEAVVAAAGLEPERSVAWLGPAIGPQAFEVGPEVREAFLAADPGAAEGLARGRGDRWQADLFALARRRLTALGIAEVYGGGLCTYSDPARFFSHRRDGPCGRMATLVWRDG